MEKLKEIITRFTGIKESKIVISNIFYVIVVLITVHFLKKYMVTIGLLKQRELFTY